MNSIMQSISGLVSGAAQSSAAAAGVKEPPKVQQPGDAAPVRSRKPVTDEYVPEEKREPSGRYWLGRDEDGQPKIYFDNPERAADAPKKPDEPSGPEKKAAGGKAERCTCSTDQVDHEIENLKKKREKLEQQISAQTDEAKIRELEQQLAQAENELSQKDNDAYRRQHAVFS